jgi:PCI domain
MRARAQNKQNRILEDAFIMQFLEPLKRRMREQVLLAIVKPYRRITIAFMAKELNQPAADVVSRCTRVNVSRSITDWCIEVYHMSSCRRCGQ